MFLVDEPQRTVAFPLDKTGAELLFEPILQRDERGSTLMTALCRSTHGPSLE